MNQSMAKTGKPSDEDSAEFRRAVGAVRRIEHDRVEPPRRKVAPRLRQRETEAPANSFAHCRDLLDDASVRAEELLFFARPGLQQRQLQRLRRGQLDCGAELDLHGMTAAGARAALSEFVAHCGAAHVRCARLIHGKGNTSSDGGPVLKNRVNAWLRQHPEVLAFCSARPRDGGSGALYVLLRSRRD